MSKPPFPIPLEFVLEKDPETGEPFLYTAEPTHLGHWRLPINPEERLIPIRGQQIFEVGGDGQPIGIFPKHRGDPLVIEALPESSRESYPKMQLSRSGKFPVYFNKATVHLTLEAPDRNSSVGMIEINLLCAHCIGTRLAEMTLRLFDNPKAKPEPLFFEVGVKPEMLPSADEVKLAVTWAFRTNRKIMGKISFQRYLERMGWTRYKILVE